jgi:methyl-accepting chemotaxis protein
MNQTISLRVKLLSAFGLTTLGMVAVGLIALYTLSTVTSDFKHVTHENMTNTVNLLQMRSAAKDLTRVVYSLILPKEHAFDDETFQKDYEQSIERFEEAQKQYLAVPFDNEKEKKLYEEQEKFWKEEVAIANECVKLGKNYDATSREAFYKKLKNDFRPAGSKHTRALHELIDFQDEDNKVWLDRADQSARLGTRNSLITIAVGSLFFILMALFLASRLTRQLALLLRQLEMGSNNVARAAIEIASTSEQFSGTSTQQASAVQETAASLHEMSSMVEKNSENAESSLRSTEESDKNGRQAQAAIQQMNSAILEINTSNEDTAKHIKESTERIGDIVKLIREIGEKTKVINDIVFQTKLLSFNASVEAARAGEHGRGFAVVAEEVGNLARMSGNAAKEIRSMLDESISLVEGIVKETQVTMSTLVQFGKGKVDAGLLASQYCGEALDALLVSVKGVSGRVKEIATASQEQAAGIRQISGAVTQLDQAAQENMNSAQQSAGSSSTLKVQAEQLEQIVFGLSSIINGDSSLHHRSFAESHLSDDNDADDTSATTNKNTKGSSRDSRGDGFEAA